MFSLFLFPTENTPGLQLSVAAFTKYFKVGLMDRLAIDALKKADVKSECSNSWIA